jgi:hypothetical protein
LLTALSGVLPRERRRSFLVQPATLLRWRRDLVRRRWTYETRRPGRPPLPAQARQLVLKLAAETPRWGWVTGTHTFKPRVLPSRPRDALGLADSRGVRGAGAAFEAAALPLGADRDDERGTHDGVGDDAAVEVEDALHECGRDDLGRRPFGDDPTVGHGDEVVRIARGVVEVV